MSFSHPFKTAKLKSQKKLITLLSVILLGSFLTGCNSPEEAEPVEFVPVVKTLSVDEIRLPTKWHLTGVVDARYQSNLAFRVGGKVTQRLVNLGDRVKPGQVLFKLDETDYLLSLKVVSANKRATQAEIKNAKLELARFQSLVKRNLTPQQNVDQAVSRLVVLEERLKSQVLQEKQAKNQLAYTTLKSPGLGKILSLQAEQDEVVSAGQTLGRLALTGSREIKVQVPETRLAQLPKQAKVQIFGQTESYPVKLRELSGEADSASRTWTAYYEFDKQSKAVALLESWNQLKIGQTAEVVFKEAQDLIKVPNTALYEEGDYVSVWQVKDSVVNRVKVKVAKLSSRWAWVDGDFSQVDKIVSLGVHKLNPGQKVKESAE